MIGNARFVVDCLAVMGRTPGSDVKLVISDPELRTMGGLVQRYCQQRDLPYLETTQVNADETLAAVEATEPDYLISVYNMRILKKRLLSIPKLGCVNYHNSLLPRYRGVNIYSWAIINGEKQHGVTWHMVDEGIDTGDILGQKPFALADDETPFTMARKCFKAGVELLGEILAPFLRGELQPKPQDHTQATYFSFKDTPNDGRIDFTWPFERIERLVRGLDFRPIENTLAYPTASVNGTTFHPQKVTYRSTGSRQGQPGEVDSVDDEAVTVLIGDGWMEMTDFLDSDHEPIAAGQLINRLGIRVGDQLE